MQNTPQTPACVDKIQFIPILNTTIGQSLTFATWNSLSINSISYYMDELIVKPGIRSLLLAKNINKFFGYNKNIVINMNNLIECDNEYKVRSRFDGNVETFKKKELEEIILRLNPSRVILPRTSTFKNSEAFIDSLRQYNIIPYLHYHEDHDTSRISGYIIFHSEKFLDTLGILNASTMNTLYVIGNLTRSQWGRLISSSKKDLSIGSDRPLLDALQAIVYLTNGYILSFLEPQLCKQFILIDPKCQCPTCSQGFTRAYLYHLFVHTPLLCCRLLFQHNVYLFNQEVNI